jgi:CheY-like chemotaxis protein
MPMAKILYVENEGDIAELVRRWLEEDGEHQALLAADGATGLKIAFAQHPDLILLDLDLGAFSDDGWEVNRQLKADSRTADIPVIALTAHAQFKEHRDRAFSEGFIAHLSKPLDYDRFTAEIRRFTTPGGTP